MFIISMDQFSLTLVAEIPSECKWSAAYVQEMILPASKQEHLVWFLCVNTQFNNRVWQTQLSNAYNLYGPILTNLSCINTLRM